MSKDPFAAAVMRLATKRPLIRPVDESATASATYNPPPPPVRYTAANEAATISGPRLELLERIHLAASVDLLELWEERAAILEADAGLKRHEAELLARVEVFGRLAEAAGRVEELYGAASVEEASAASDHWQGPQRKY
jgi:hypothetical protein